jgi:hypothetical protein
MDEIGPPSAEGEAQIGTDWLSDPASAPIEGFQSLDGFIGRR